MINDESIKPLLQLLVDPSQDKKLNRVKAEIAYIMIYTGFHYLQDIEYEDMTLSHERAS